MRSTNNGDTLEPESLNLEIEMPASSALKSFTPKRYTFLKPLKLNTRGIPSSRCFLFLVSASCSNFPDGFDFSIDNFFFFNPLRNLIILKLRNFLLTSPS